MIQDIEPHVFNNQYKIQNPKDDSYILFFKEKRVLISNKEDLTFPKYEQVKAISGNYTYLFSIDDISYFISDRQIELDGFVYVGKEEFRNLKPKHMAFAGITAYQIKTWYDNNKFCGCCGRVLVHSNKERALHCKNCENTVYPRINPAVIVAVTNGDKLLLTRYNNRPYRRYALIAGFNEVGESLEETVKREVMEEAGLQVKNIRYYKSQPWGFADDILMGYFCEVEGNDSIKIDEEELAEGIWVEREKINVEFEDLSLTNEMICVFKEGKI
jgi:NAD+ diphosphatase